MNKIVIGLLAVVIIGAGVWYVMSGNTETGDTAAAADANAQTGAFSGSGTIADLMNRDGSYQCTFTVDMEGVTSAGTVYLAGGSMRGDFTGTVEGIGSVTAHTLMDGEYVYSWTDMMPQGYKMPVSVVADASTQTTASQGIDFNQQVQYDCVAWEADPSKFVVPSDITFATTVAPKD